MLLEAETTTWPAVFRWSLPGPGKPFVSIRAGQKAGFMAAYRYLMCAADAGGYPRETSISGTKSRGKPHFSNSE
ncbi:hypothetical protein C4K38_4384 [Pseudomonas chlororaphis subsp. piscium]|nr:hypothetical protein C4K38_4384 [Pseudomonas chlororaphis subsp. piscium]